MLPVDAELEMRCARSASCSVSSRATVCEVSAVRPRSCSSPTSSRISAEGICSSSSCSSDTNASSASRWVLTDTYSPSAIDDAPATSPASPALAIT